MINRGNLHVTGDGDAYTDLYFEVRDPSRCANCKRFPYWIAILGHGFEVTHKLTADDLIEIRDWIDRVLADHEVAA